MALHPTAVDFAARQKARQTRIDLAHLRMAFALAHSLSKDPSTRCGALLVSPDGRKVSMGYNGMVAGIDESNLWDDRPTKLAAVIHAEENALLNAPFDRMGCTIYCTLAPCAQCLKKIVQAGVVRVVHYGPAWERETEQDLVDLLKDRVAWERYDDDPMIEAIKGPDYQKLFLDAVRVGNYGIEDPSTFWNDSGAQAEWASLASMQPQEVGVGPWRWIGNGGDIPGYVETRRNNESPLVLCIGPDGYWRDRAKEIHLDPTEYRPLSSQG